LALRTTNALTENCLIVEEADENFQSVQIMIKAREKEEPTNHSPTPYLEGTIFSHLTILCCSIQ